jgi:hypothetical protein
MMAMTTIARYVAMPQQKRHGKITRRSVQQNIVISHTMLVQYAGAAIIN